jgi:sugar (pentulose or hexulose) kinase
LEGLAGKLPRLSKEVLARYGTPLKTIGAIGFSAMMHGYMAFDSTRSCSSRSAPGATP